MATVFERWAQTARELKAAKATPEQAEAAREELRKRFVEKMEEAKLDSATRAAALSRFESGTNALSVKHGLKKEADPLTEDERYALEHPVLGGITQAGKELVAPLAQGVQRIAGGAARLLNDIGDNEKGTVLDRFANNMDDAQKSVDDWAGQGYAEADGVRGFAKSALQNTPQIALSLLPGAALGKAAALAKAAKGAQAGDKVLKYGMPVAAGISFGQNYAGEYGDARKQTEDKLAKATPDDLRASNAYGSKFKSLERKFFDDGLSADDAATAARDALVDSIAERRADAAAIINTGLEFVAPGAMAVMPGFAKTGSKKMASDLALAGKMASGGRFGSKAANLSDLKDVGLQFLQEGFQGGVTERAAEGARANAFNDKIDYGSVLKSAALEAAAGGIIGGASQMASGGTSRRRAQDAVKEAQSIREKYNSALAGANAELQRLSEIRNQRPLTEDENYELSAAMMEAERARAVVSEIDKMMSEAGLQNPGQPPAPQSTQEEGRSTPEPAAGQPDITQNTPPEPAAGQPDITQNTPPEPAAGLSGVIQRAQASTATDLTTVVNEAIASGQTPDFSALAQAANRDRSEVVDLFNRRRTLVDLADAGDLNGMRDMAARMTADPQEQQSLIEQAVAVRDKRRAMATQPQPQPTQQAEPQKPATPIKTPRDTAYEKMLADTEASLASGASDVDTFLAVRKKYAGNKDLAETDINGVIDDAKASLSGKREAAAKREAAIESAIPHLKAGDEVSAVTALADAGISGDADIQAALKEASGRIKAEQKVPAAQKAPAAPAAPAKSPMEQAVSAVSAAEASGKGVKLATIAKKFGVGIADLAEQVVKSKRAQANTRQPEDDKTKQAAVLALPAPQDAPIPADQPLVSRRGKLLPKAQADAMAEQSAAEKRDMRRAMSEEAGNPTGVPTGMRPRVETPARSVQKAVLPDVILRNDGEPFPSETEATRAMNRKGAQETHEVTPAPKGNGVVIKRKQANTIDVEKDDILAAIAKAGGVNWDQARKHGGFDPAESWRRGSGILRVFKKNGGMTLDGMAEHLSQFGYPVTDENGDYTVNALLDAMDAALRGGQVGTAQFNERLAREMYEKEAELRAMDDALDGGSSSDMPSWLDDGSDSMVESLIDNNVQPSAVMADALNEVENEREIASPAAGTGQETDAGTEARGGERGNAPTAGSREGGQQEGKGGAGQDPGVQAGLAGNWIGADRFFETIATEEYGPAPRGEAIGFIKSSPAGTTALETVVRPSGKRVHFLLLSGGSGEYAQDFASPEKTIGSIVASLQKDIDGRKKRLDEQQRKLNDAQANEKAVAERNKYQAGVNLGDITPNTGKMLRASRIVVDNGDGTFDVEGTAGNKTARISGMSASSIERAVKRAKGQDDFSLLGQTEAERFAEEQRQAAMAEAQRKEEERARLKAQADREISSFTLTGSDRPADVAMAAGQSDLFGPKTRGEKAAKADEVPPQASDFPNAASYHAALADFRKANPPAPRADTEQASSDRRAEIKRELAVLEKQYKKLMNKRSGLVPPSIKSDALNSIARKMSSLDAELKELDAAKSKENPVATIKTDATISDADYAQVVEAAKYLKDIVYSMDNLVGGDTDLLIALSSDLGKSGRDTILMDAFGIDRSLAHTINNRLDDRKPHKLRAVDMGDAFTTFPMLRKVVDDAKDVIRERDERRAARDAESKAASQQAKDATTDTAESKPEPVREMTEEGRAKDGKPITGGDKFRTSSGRETTTYPHQKSEKYASQWLIDNATAEAEARGDDFNAPIFRRTTLRKNGTLTDADRDSMLMYLFGEQPKVVPSILKPLVSDLERAQAIVHRTASHPVTEQERALLQRESDKQRAAAINLMTAGESMKAAGIEFENDGPRTRITRNGIPIGSLEGKRDRETVLRVLQRNHGEPPQSTQDNVRPMDSQKKGGPDVARLRTKDAVIFDNPYTGKDGNKLTGYDWSNREEHYTDERGNDRTRLVSDWEGASTNNETGRDIVHRFIIEDNIGNERIVSAETAADLLGISEREVRQKAQDMADEQAKEEQAKKAEAEFSRQLENEKLHGTPADAVDAMLGELSPLQQKQIAAMREGIKSGDYYLSSQKMAFIEKGGKYLFTPAGKTNIPDAAKGFKAVEIPASEVFGKEKQREAQKQAENKPPREQLIDEVADAIRSAEDSGLKETASRLHNLTQDLHARIDTPENGRKRLETILHDMKNPILSGEWVSLGKGRTVFRWEGMDYGRIEDTRITEDRSSSVSDPWKTSDGQTHATLRDAKRHELAANSRQRLIHDGYMTDESSADQSKAEESAKPGTITDFGEKIGGARKDVWQSYEKSLSDELPDDASEIKLSKHFPEPDYDAAMAAGVPEESLAAVKAMRDEIPAKPQKSWKVKQWADKVRVLREFAADIMSGKVSVDNIKQKMREAGRLMDGFANRIELYKEVGYPRFTRMQGKNIEHAVFNMFKGETRPGGIPKYVLSEAGKGDRYYDTRQQALDALKGILDSELNAGATARTTKLDIYRVTSTGDIIIGKKVAAGKYIDLKTGFKSPREAHEYLAAHQDELMAELERKKETKPERKAVNDPRQGEDYRKGEDVTPEKFSNTFGFRGVEFGNYVEGARRQQDLNNAYDALLDLATILNVPPKALSLNGSLGLAFGARGSGGKGAAAAHFEPSKVVINLTKGNGAGSLAHEWFHALDNYFSRARGQETGHISDSPHPKMVAGADRKLVEDTRVRKEVLDAWKGVMDAIRESGMVERSKQLDTRKSKDYWSTPHELTARAFEKYIIDRAAEKQASNDYLANVLPEEFFDKEDPTPYPTNNEAVKINAAYQKLFDTMKHEVTDKGVKLYSTADTSGPGLTTSRAREILSADPVLSKAMPFIDIRNSREGVPEGAEPFGEEGYYHNGRITLFADNIRATGSMSAEERLKWVAFHEITHRGVANLAESQAYLSELERAGKNPYVKNLAKKIYDARQLLDEKYHVSMEVATEEALAEINAALRTGNVKQIKEQYGLHFPLSIRPRAKSAAARFIEAVKRIINRMFGRGLTDAQVENLLRKTHEAGMGPDGINPSGRRNSFAGENSKTADMTALDKAKQRVAAGDNAEAVRKDTGWHTGTDGKWRFEISDADARLTPAIKSLASGGYDAADIQSVTYRKNDDGSYSVALMHEGAKDSSGFVNLDSIPEEVVRAILPDDVFAAVQRGDGEADFIGANLDDAKTIKMPFRFEGMNALPLDMVIDHPALFAAYPALRQVMVKVDPKAGIGGSLAEMADGTFVITVGAGQQQSTMLHEIQHAIQSYEGFASGGSLDSARKAAYEKNESRRKQINAEIEALGRLRSSIPTSDSNAYQRNVVKHKELVSERDALDEAQRGLRYDHAPAAQAYKRLAGEVEARNTQARASMSDAERRATSPQSTADVAERDQIVTFAKGLAQMVSDKPTDADLVEAQRQLEEQLAIADRMIAERGGLFAPNGEKSKLNRYQWAQVRTENFNGWFGDWETDPANASKVVDENGEPLVVYHGTNNEFTEFKPSDSGVYGGGVYFTKYAGNASAYGKNNIAAYLSIQNPIFTTRKEAREIMARKGGTQQWANEARAAGHDGIYVSDEEFYIAFSPTQIKSATGNAGTFSGKTDDIRYSPSPKDWITEQGRITKRVLSKEVAQRDLTPWQKTLGTPLNAALKNPAFKKVYDLTQRLIQHINNDAYDSLNAAPDVLSRLEDWNDYKRDIANTVKEAGAALTMQQSKRRKDMAAAAEVLFEGTRFDKKVYSDEELDAFKLTADQKEIYRQARAAIDKSVGNAGKSQALNVAMNAEAINWATVERLVNMDLDPEVLFSEVSDLIDTRIAATKMEAENSTSEAEIKKLDKQAEKLSAALASIGEIQAIVEKSATEGYAPLMRWGKYTVTVIDPVDGKTLRFHMLESKREQAALELQLREKYGAANVVGDVLDEGKFEQFKGITPETVALFASVTGMDQDAAYQEYLKLAIPGRSALKRKIHRKGDMGEGIEGFSTDLPRVLSSFVLSNARKSARDLYRGPINDAIKDIKVGGGVAAKARELAEFVMEPDENDWSVGIRNMLFVWNMGASVAFGVLNLSQPWMMTLPWLSQFQDPASATGTMVKAAKLAASAQASGKAPKGYEAEYSRAVREGIVDPQNVFMLQGVERGKSGVGTNIWRNVAHGMGLIASATESMNRKLTLIAALDVARAKGDAWLKSKGFADAYDFAARAVAETQGVYNKGNRPAWARNPALAVILVFKQYSINWVEMASRMASNHYGDDRYRKGFWMLVGALFMMAGGMGLPFADDLIDLIEAGMSWAGKPVNVERQMQMALGKDLYEPLMNGPVNSMLFNPMGADMFGRMSMGNMIPATAIANPGLTWAARSDEAVQALGAGAGLASKFVDSYNMAATGNVGQALINASPRAVTSVAKAVEMATTNQYKDSKGRTVRSVTPAEALIKGLDLQPASVARIQRERSRRFKDEAIQAQAKTEIRNELIDAYESGDQDAIEEANARLRDWNDANPLYPVHINRRALRKTVRERGKNWSARDEAAKGMEWLNDWIPESSK